MDVLSRKPQVYFICHKSQMLSETKKLVCFLAFSRMRNFFCFFFYKKKIFFYDMLEGRK